MPAVQQTIDQVRRIDVDQYKYGFETTIESIKAPKGLDEETVRFISRKKGEPGWMLEWRLEAYRRWKTMPTRWNTQTCIAACTICPTPQPPASRMRARPCGVFSMLRRSRHRHCP